MRHITFRARRKTSCQKLCTHIHLENVPVARHTLVLALGLVALYHERASRHDERAPVAFSLAIPCIHAQNISPSPGSVRPRRRTCHRVHASSRCLRSQSSRSQEEREIGSVVPLPPSQRMVLLPPAPAFPPTPTPLLCRPDKHLTPPNNRR
ncbi:MAG: hypothetical protein FE78DRAFT_518744 [Acidomyces sp. 'richmondensis']|nr:MAG: hypothetical protein FE78DRAFT_518744 [Acidomyces sp. 'richmondensis']